MPNRNIFSWWVVLEKLLGLMSILCSLILECQTIGWCHGGYTHLLYCPWCGASWALPTVWGVSTSIPFFFKLKNVQTADTAPFLLASYFGASLLSFLHPPSWACMLLINWYLTFIYLSHEIWTVSEKGGQLMQVSTLCSPQGYVCIIMISNSNISNLKCPSGYLICSLGWQYFKKLYKYILWIAQHSYLYNKLSQWKHFIGHSDLKAVFKIF